MLIDPVEMLGTTDDRALRAQAHDRSLAELLLNLSDRDLDGFRAFAGYPFRIRHGFSILFDRPSLHVTRRILGSCQPSVKRKSVMKTT